MELNAFLDALKTRPESIEFSDTIAVIEATYNFEPTAFVNGDTRNEAGQNNGSCKIFAFGLLNDLTPAQTLQCFGQYYRVDVLQNPDNTDHQNIRNFMVKGWEGVKFDSQALAEK